ncbi:uncharacterized protein LOC127249996 [Andrographis paniculata]|uniref:uncharacterized protein LOC127249996 n=1 Tax=Andrographis paniculata TaxID=175694 RepID=UPI0021E7FE51|nr:uncharacterized protein LOC127249996 [Andrographis paniculata]XP_051129085.1 uncharacterized protein LOC127249996 [Andrographis paniculata]XP_051129086.1 uncharacterized protein LOC127249996 [Andrographis paniculata]XP_051129087.1 uncharacterized protein LOC127249996 [Andrographis paniculata]
MAEVSITLPAKRKRGRPRKDSNIFRQSTLQSPESANLLKTQHAEVRYSNPDSAAKAQEPDSKDGIADGLAGSMIYGVIEGSFDAGYFVSVRIGNSSTPFRGVVFQPGKIVPVTAANDVAPQAKMYNRRDIPVPVYDNFSQISGTMNSQHEKVLGQATAGYPALPSLSPPVTPYSVGNLSNFIATEPIMLRTNSSSNIRGGEGTAAIPKSPPTGVSQQSPSLHPTSIGMLEQHDEGSKKNMAAAAAMGDMVSGSTSSSLSHAEKPEGGERAAELSPGQGFLAHNRQNNNNSNVELHLDSNPFGIQQDKIIFREMDRPREYVHDRQQQTPAIELQELPAVSVPDQATKTDLYFGGLRTSDVNFPQYLLADQSQLEKGIDTTNFHSSDMVAVGNPSSPNLKLDLSSSIHEKKPIQQQQIRPQSSERNDFLAFNGLKNNPNVGYHQALVSGNPLFLPTSPDFIMDKTKSFSAPQETNLELATPQSNLNVNVGAAQGKQTSMSSYMDFVLTDAVQPTAEPHGRCGGDIS